MNAAMMRAEVKKKFPSVFSIPGETEIKKYISQLFMKSKHNSDDMDSIDNNATNESDTIQIRQAFNWQKIVKEIVDKDPHKKPKEIYNEFILQVSNDNKAQIPQMKVVKQKISQMKQLLRKRLMRSIVQS